MIQTENKTLVNKRKRTISKITLSATAVLSVAAFGVNAHADNLIANHTQPVLQTSDPIGNNTGTSDTPNASGDTGESNTPGDTGNTGETDTPGDTSSPGDAGGNDNSGDTGNTGNTGGNDNTGDTGNTGGGDTPGDTGNAGGNEGSGNNTGNTGGSGTPGNTGGSGHTEKPKPKPKPTKPKPSKPHPSAPKPASPAPSAPAAPPVSSAPTAPSYTNSAPTYVAPQTAQDAETTYKQASTDGDLKFHKTNIAVAPLTKINNQTLEDFIKSIAPRISQLAGQNNLYASLIIAQAILESGYGHSNVALDAHNLFNIIGAFNGQSITISSGAYRAYDTYDQSLVDYIHLMLHGTTWNSKIYAGSWKTNSSSVDAAAHSLQGIFATDSEYASKLLEIIKEYNLTQYDYLENLSQTVKKGKAPASPVLEAMPSSLKFPEYNGKQYAGAASYAWGNCTQYVYNRILQLGGKIGQFLGNGGVWGSNAAAQGYYTTTTPQLGYAVSFPPGVAGASAEYGHVAFVEKVNKDGSILVSEMNVKGLNVVDYRSISASDASLSTYIKPQ